MRALVVFESMFGNTKEIAAAIAEGLAAEVSVDLVEVNDATTEVGRDVGLLVGGGPTHAFRMSRPRTRRDAATQAGRDPASAGIGIREWLAALRRVAPGKSAAAFDTRIDAPRVPGSAARAAERRLRKLGFSTAAPAESFFVSGTPRPLVRGELERRVGGAHSSDRRSEQRRGVLPDDHARVHGTGGRHPPSVASFSRPPGRRRRVGSRSKCRSPARSSRSAT